MLFITTFRSKQAGGARGRAQSLQEELLSFTYVLQTSEDYQILIPLTEDIQIWINPTATPWKRGITRFFLSFSKQTSCTRGKKRYSILRTIRYVNSDDTWKSEVFSESGFTGPGNQESPTVDIIQWITDLLHVSYHSEEAQGKTKVVSTSPLAKKVNISYSKDQDL